MADAKAEMEERCRREVLEVHDYFTKYFQGTIPRETIRTFRERFAADLTYIYPGGTRGGAGIFDWMEKEAHGSSPEFRIKIDEASFTFRHLADGVCVVNYHEYQKGARNSDPTNGRLTTAIYERHEDAPCGVRWLHLHEVWLPAETVSAFHSTWH
eukprot:Sspe_Gene.5971::Locus_1996_Transcript_1_1_Confidence_1.000_Length_710::g.5971::m.5971